MNPPFPSHGKMFDDDGSPPPLLRRPPRRRRRRTTLGRIDSVYPIIKGAELTPLAAHFRSPPAGKRREKNGRRRNGPKRERENKERRRFICREIDDGDGERGGPVPISCSQAHVHCARRERNEIPFGLGQRPILQSVSLRYYVQTMTDDFQMFDRRCIFTVEFNQISDFQQPQTL